MKLADWVKQSKLKQYLLEKSRGNFYKHYSAALAACIGFLIGLREDVSNRLSPA